MQLIGLKMEVEEDEFDVDREGLSIAAGINENLSEQVGSPAHVLEQEDRVLESQTMLCNAGAGLHIPADSHAYIVEASCHANDLRSITKDITVFVVSAAVSFGKCCALDRRVGVMLSITILIQIRVLGVQRTNQKFEARNAAHTRTYHYYLPLDILSSGPPGAHACSRSKCQPQSHVGRTSLGIKL